MRIAIAGGTGTVGRHIVRVAEERGFEAVVLSRSTGVDLTEGGAAGSAPLADLLAGSDAVIDASSVGTLDSRESVAFFTAVTRNLLAAERAAGTRHHIALSIVGAAAADTGYYAGKAAQEALVEQADVPWTILRTTQFHEFAQQTAGRAPVLGRHLVPAMRSQPVAASEVAVELVRLAEDGPSGQVPDLAGPHEERMSAMVAAYLRAVGRPARVTEIPLPGGMGRVMRSGGLLPGPGARLGTQTYAEWVAALA